MFVRRRLAPRTGSHWPASPSRDCRSPRPPPRAGQLHHRRVSDTALVYDPVRGRPYKPALRWLAEHYLQQQIQTGEHGHDSVEDARTALALVQLKLRNGLGFGEQRHASESLFTRLHRHGRRGALADTAAVVLPNARPPATALACTSDHEVVAQVLTAATDHDFVLARLTGLEHYYSACRHCLCARRPLSAPPPPSSSQPCS